MMPGNLSPKLSALEIQFDLIRNAEVYEKRLKELKDAAQAFKQEREKLTKAKDIDQALADAKQSAESARQALSDARSEAAHIVNQAEEKAADIVAGAQARAAKIVQSANESVAGTLQQITDKQAEFERLKSSADSLVSQLEAMTDQYDGLAGKVRLLESRKAELLELIADKQRKLKALMAE